MSNKALEIDAAKLTELRDLVNSIPTNCGEQFVHVSLSLYNSLSSGTISYGLNYKMEMAEVEFYTLDEAIKIVTGLKKRANPVEMKWDDDE